MNTRPHDSTQCAPGDDAETGPGESFRALPCRCAWQAEEQEVTLPKGDDNIINRLLLKDFNRSPENVRSGLKEYEEEDWGRRVEVAARAGVSLLQLKQVLIYSDEECKDNARLEVPRQVKFVGTMPVISSSLANTACAELGPDGMLEHLNETLRTTYTLNRPGLFTVLQSYVDGGFDFGLAYGYLRFWWFEDFTRLQENMKERAAADKLRRHEAAHGMYVVDRKLPPRRAWDLYSNRVLPWWLFREWDLHDCKWVELKKVDAVSHSWVHPNDRQPVSTPINSHKWPVPVPKDTTLDRIRVELLNVGREVIWLDVLCLWQEGIPDHDEARWKQWKLDVPTIGHIYQLHNKISWVVTYFNGLGRPFCIGNLDDERHWLNRAWTLQEFSNLGIIGGLVPGSFPPRLDDDGRIVDSDPSVTRFYQRLQAASNSSLRGMGYNITFSVLASMGPRHAAHPVDKIGGITHLLSRNKIPIYTRDDPSYAERNAWDLLIPVMGYESRAELFFLYPARGDGKYAWCPSWDQIKSFLPPVPSFILEGEINYNKEYAQFRCVGLLLEDCALREFAKPDPDGYCRTGTLRLVHHDAVHSFKVTAHHQESIPDGSYALIGKCADDSEVLVWAVGTLNSDERFEKLSVLRTEDGDDIMRLEKLELIKSRAERRLIVLA